jgi:Lon protease-like protein
MATATSTKLPDRIPLFPLPNVVLFPGMPLPLHIFEPRYREMVTAAMAGDKTIGMVLLKPGYEADYEGRPPIFETGCAGLIERCEALEDGRFNILLRGSARFRVESEHPGASYRIASVAALAGPAEDPEALLALHPQLLASIGTASDGPAVLVMQSELPPDVFVNALCQTLALTPIERQSLLGCDTTLARGHRLLEILQWKALDQVMGKGQTETVH